MRRLAGNVSTVIGIAGAVCALGCGPRRLAISMAGSTAFQPFAEKLAGAFMATHPGVTITAQVGGSAAGVQAALSGAAQIGVADFADLPPQAEGLSGVIVAHDGIVVIVNPANPVADLSEDRVRGLFSGEIANWREVGGVDHSVSVVVREMGSGTRASFEEIMRLADRADNEVVEDSTGAVRETVANDVNAVGYVSHGSLNDKVKAVSIDGVACTEPEIKSARYKLVRPIFLLTRGPATGLSREFIDYVLSADGQALLTANGLIAVGG